MPTSSSLPRAASGPRAVFRIRDFTFLQIAKSLATLGFFMEVTTVGYQVYSLTRQQLNLGLVGLAYFLPAVLLALATGYVADRFDRRRVAQICQAGSLLVAGALAWISHQAGGAVPPHAAFLGILGAVFLSGAVHAFYGPAIQALLPSLVPREQLSNAITWNSALWQGMAIAGPALGGLSLARFGPGGTYLIEMIFYGAAIVCMGFIRRRPGPVPGGTTGASWDRLVAGLRFIRSRPVLLGAISMDLFAVLLGGATALLPVFAQDILRVDERGFGLLRASPAIGAGLMSIAIAHRPPMRHAGRSMMLAVALFGVATVAFGLSRSFALSVVCLVTLGACDMISVVVRQTLVQAMTPDAMRGRVSAVNLVFIGASNELGEFESGTLAHWIGTVPTVVAGGLGTLAVVGLWAWLFPDLRRFGSLDTAHHTPQPGRDSEVAP